MHGYPKYYIGIYLRNNTVIKGGSNKPIEIVEEAQGQIWRIVITTDGYLIDGHHPRKYISASSEEISMICLDYYDKDSKCLIPVSTTTFHLDTTGQTTRKTTTINPNRPPIDSQLAKLNASAQTAS